MRSRLVVRAARVHDRERALLEERLEARHPRVQSEKAVEIDRAVSQARARLRNGDRRPRVVVSLLAEWDDHVQAVYGAALEDGDEDLLPGPRGLHRS
jgi:hypothetical protein